MHTFASPLERAVRVAPDAWAVVCDDRRRTYADFGARCRRLGGAMRALGIGRGDRVAILAQNSDAYLELYLGLPAAGVVPVPINTRLADPEIRYILEDSGSRLLLTDRRAGGLGGHVERVVRICGEYDALLEGSEELPLGADIAEDDFAVFFYTSGTTGAAKGTMHSHRGLLSSAQNFMATWRFGPDTRWLVCAPMFHTAGILATLATVWHGGTHVIMPSFDPAMALDLVEREQISHTLMVPTMLAAAADEQLERPRDVRSLRFLSHGGSPIAVETLRRAHRAFPAAELLHVYGTTETTPVTTLMPQEERVLDRPELGSCGTPAVGVEVRIVDENGLEVEPGTVGEVVVRSPSLMLGYWNKPEATAAVIRDGWYRTGDLGFADTRSRIFLVDRAKDMIVTGGENVYSPEVENVLYDHPAVVEAAVFGIPDDRWGEAVHAVVVPRDDAIAAEALIQHCRERIAGYKVPKRVEFRETPLPKNATGKILKRELREPFWVGRETRVGGS